METPRADGAADTQSDTPHTEDYRFLSRVTTQRRWRELAVVSLLFIIVTLFHWRGLAQGTVFLAVDIAQNQLPWALEGGNELHNWLLSDPIWQSYPFIAHAIGPESNSFWNPDIFLGHPRIADPLAQPFYPVFRLMGRVFGAARGSLCPCGCMCCGPLSVCTAFFAPVESLDVPPCLAALPIV